MGSIWRDKAYLEKLNSLKTVRHLSDNLFKKSINPKAYINPISKTFITNGLLDIAYYI